MERDSTGGGDGLIRTFLFGGGDGLIRTFLFVLSVCVMWMTGEIMVGGARRTGGGLSVTYRELWWSFARTSM